MNWNYIFNGFHGYSDVTVRVPDGSRAGDCVALTAGQRDRILRQICGSADCRCGETGGLHTQDGEHYYLTLPEQGGEVTGLYPQR